VGMRLIPALGSRDIQDAIKNVNVNNVVSLLLLLLEVDIDLFILFASFLRRNEQKSTSNFFKQLQNLKSNRLKDCDAEGKYAIAPYTDELCQAILAVYDASPLVVGYRRGAIVELLTYALVSHRCKEGECKGNHRFLYPSRPSPHHRSDQVDVAVLSELKLQIEGYSCKMQVKYIESMDCTNLQQLSHNGNEGGYAVHIGVVSFDSSKKVRRRLKDLSSPELNLFFEDTIQPYGLDNLIALTQSPFS
jgi:hypothetical protein